ncbi:MAG: AraC family transcriptional regulator [Hydrogenophaga sp.]|nr:AraC family transcriptional regulator [Hydrogenophaga sp.]MDZ4237686.1 AraC family transcriptional regulator [Hydrogenophaga sp.]
MLGSHAIPGVVYLGHDWLLYADPDLRFNLSQNVAPALVFGPPLRPATLTLRNGSEVCAPVLLHASGAWSCMTGRSAMAFLYVDPLSDVGFSLQQRAQDSVAPWPDADLMHRNGVDLEDLCCGAVHAAQAGRWVAGVLAEVADLCGGSTRMDPRLAGLRERLHQRGEGRASPATMARELGLSAEHVRKLFRQQVGMTLSSYQSWVRLYLVAVGACEAQQRGQPHSATELVSAGGFYDASHASRAIRRYFDLLPTEMLAPRAFVDCRQAG